MHDDPPFAAISELLMSLVDHPGVSWAKGDLDDVRMDIECGEYENPLGNIIAMGLQSNEGFDASQLKTLNALLDLMPLEDSPWVIKLRQYERSMAIKPTCNRP